MNKVVILIDGQNLYYNLKDISLKENNIKWDLLFSHLIEPDDKLVRTYWFRPAKILDTYYTSVNIRNTIVWKLHRTHTNNYQSGAHSSIPKQVLDDIEDKSRDIEKWLADEKQRFNSLEFQYDKLCLEFGGIEFVKTGVVKVNPYNKSYSGEKGVDISLAVKMIALSVEKKCDKIILVSGDYDYAEAIRYVKNNMTQVHIVKMHKGNPPKSKSVSRDLIVLADKVIDLYETDIHEKFLKGC
ncbi:NYN domain-containing protein [Chitinophaga nivalis]|uniref:NYN domain-containing protein n=1 Tax=Chitinophaga nivalis TaxID=2991709 RepID=A0ABT3IF13_9BACT|nr:NYN domain-containing protein [Chitinophaga nivalis]MCW3467759.1 NYN domain-containing protein [Chitinophaga nivalis]MCW3482549.1 NYN domain-containing protein [Chitinophaga nivalis]